MVSAVLFLSFGVSCLLDWLGQPFFVCHQHLWFGLSFFATSICGLFFLSLPQAFVYSLFHSLWYNHTGWLGIKHQLTYLLSFVAFSAVGINVSACFRVSVYLSIFGIMLCTCCLSASSLEIRTGIFSKLVTLWTALQIPLWSKPHWYSAIKFTKLHSAKCLLHKINGHDWGAASKSARLNCANLTHFRLTAGRFRGN